MDTSCALKIIDLSEIDSDENEDEAIEDCETPMYDYNSSGPPPLTSIKKLQAFQENCENVMSEHHTDAENHIFPNIIHKNSGKLFVVKKGELTYRILVPRSILPIINKSDGPVYMDIPNIGCVQIRSNSEQENDLMQKESKHLSPFSLNFDDDVSPNSALNQTCDKLYKDSASSVNIHSSRSNINVHNRCIGNNIAYGYTKLKAKTSKHNESRLTNRSGTLKDKIINDNLVQPNNQLGKQKQNQNWNNDFSYQGYVQIIDPRNYHRVIKPCYVSLEKDKKLDEIYNKLIETRNDNKVKSKMELRDSEKIKIIRDNRISTHEELINALALIKPTVVINKHNYKILDFKTYYSKANIVFPVNQGSSIPRILLDDVKLFPAIMEGYIKVVDSKILCDYFVGNIGPTTQESDCVPIDL